jgi:hypothetical protein
LRAGLADSLSTQRNADGRPYDSDMAFDEGLAGRVRGVLAAAGVTPVEKKMFGGISFLINGNMCCGVLGPDLLARVGPDAAGGALAEPATRPFDMGRGPSRGWVMVGPEGITTDDALTAWVDRSLAFATSLPPK